MKTAFIVFASSFVASVTALTLQAAERPNIVLIMADDLGFETLGLYGGESYETPQLDRMAEQGMRFESCYSTPLCTPSRVQIMTGQYNHRNYVAFGMLRPGETTFAHLLGEAGYAVGITGKWQLYGNPGQRKLSAPAVGSLPTEAGFDEYHLWQVDEGPWEARYKDPRITITGAEPEVFEGEYGPDRYTAFALDFIERHRDEPFLLYYPMCLTHDPFQPTPEDEEDYAALDPAHRLNDPAWFGGYVSYMDRLVGRIVGKVDELGLGERTLILFTGDNGTDTKVTSRWRGRTVKGMKGQPVELGTHVPLLARWTGTVPAGSVDSGLVDFTDFLPTLVDVAGVGIPDGLEVDGMSFLHRLRREPGPGREWVFCHYRPRWGRWGDARYVHDTDWKLYEDGRVFNIRTDPLEETPLDPHALGDEVQDRIRTFRAVLASKPVDEDIVRLHALMEAPG
jgi:arylsulfatase A-like enzyme